MKTCGNPCQFACDERHRIRTIFEHTPAKRMFMNNDLKSSTRYVLGLFAVDNIKISDFGMSVIRRIDSGEITIAEGKQLIVNEAKKLAKKGSNAEPSTDV